MLCAMGSYVFVLWVVCRRLRALTMGADGRADKTKSRNVAVPGFVAVRTGLEPVTPCVTGTYSNQLN